MYLFENILGAFVFDEHFKLVESADLAENLKHHNAKEIDEKSYPKILEFFKDKKFHSQFHEKNVHLSRIQVRDSVNTDLLVSQAVNSFEEIEKVSNSLAKRLRDWYELYNPEISVSIKSHSDFVKKILSSSKKELLHELKIKKEDSLGADIEDGDLEQIISLAKKLDSLYAEKESLQDYISNLMGRLCPNIKEIAGVMIGAKLLEHAGSLKRLSEMPASTIQILGAETALFRHLKTGARPPRHGMIVSHPLISAAPERLHGKIARALADKISIAAKVDYFKGEFIGDSLKKQLEEKVSRMK